MRILFYIPFISIIILTGCGYSPHLIQKNKPMTNTTLNVNISNGMAFSQKLNSLQNYQPVNFQIPEGSCKQVTVALSNNEMIPLESCYKNNVLLLDIQNAKGKKINQPVRIDWNPLWQQGFTYNNITTVGGAHLSNVTIYVKMNTAP